MHVLHVDVKNESKNSALRAIQDQYVLNLKFCNFDNAQHKLYYIMRITKRIIVNVTNQSLKPVL